MSRIESVEIPLTAPVSVGTVDTVLLDWRQIVSVSLPRWECVAIAVLNLDASNQVAVSLLQSAQPPLQDDPYVIAVPPLSQRSVMIDSMAGHHWLKLVARAAQGTAQVRYELLVRQGWAG